MGNSKLERTQRYCKADECSLRKPALIDRDDGKYFTRALFTSQGLLSKERRGDGEKGK